jgi:C1A family cysteine protease
MKKQIVTLLAAVALYTTFGITTTRGEESVTKRPIEQITGLVIPDDLPERVEQQQTEAAIVESAYAAHISNELRKATADAEKKRIFGGLGVPNMAALAENEPSVSTEALQQAVAAAIKPIRLVDPKASKFDLRDLGVVTEVRDQHHCGSCWAFGSIAAFETAYALANNKTKIHCAEQALISCDVNDHAKDKNGNRTDGCHGGFWAFGYTQYVGLPNYDSFKPTTAGPNNQTSCPTNLRNLYRAANWNYVHGLEPSVQEMKDAISKYGALLVGMNATPELTFLKKDEVFSLNQPGNINHAVVIIGWDDSKGAWLIKNSWGRDWPASRAGGHADGGFGWIKYGSNKIGYGAAYVIATSEKVKLPVAATMELLDQVKRNLGTLRVRP